MQNIKQFNRGEILFKENDSSEFVYFIQSGRVSLYIERNGKKIEIDQLGGSQVVGELVVLGVSKQPYSAEALGTVKVLEVPVKLLKSLQEGAAPGIKLLVRSTTECLKQARQKMRSVKMEQDNSPCPQVMVPKLFSLFVLMAKHIGKAGQGSEFIISWQALKTYATRVFLESPPRLQSGLELLKKLGYAEITTHVNEEGEEELKDITFKDIATVEAFADFYQYHLYKPGRSEAMYVDELAFKIIKGFVALSINTEVNHRGAVDLSYDDVIKHMKEKHRIDLKNTHLDLLEKKGLLVQRKSTDNGLRLLFDKDEFIKTAVYWAFIHEIDQWNTKGYIDFKPPKEESVQGEGGSSCPECQGEIKAEQKFCHHCGSKLVAAA